MTIVAGTGRAALALVCLLVLIGASVASEGRKPEQIYTPPQHIEVSPATLLLETFNDELFPQRWRMTSDPDYTGTYLLGATNEAISTCLPILVSLSELESN